MLSIKDNLLSLMAVRLLASTELTQRGAKASIALKWLRGKARPPWRAHTANIQALSLEDFYSNFLHEI
jgi:hypothetical protein